MTRRFVLPLCLFLTSLAACSRGPAQIYFPPYPRPYPRPIYHSDPNQNSSPIEIGGYLAAGGAGLETPPHGGGVPVGMAGVYGQWNRRGLDPGVDFRLQGNSGYLHGVLVGPRLAYKPSQSGGFSNLRPYVEVLFGPNELTRSGSSGLASPLPDYRGVTTAGIVGLDADLGDSFRWRILEFTKESFTGISGSQPYTIMTGFVIHVP